MSIIRRIDTDGDARLNFAEWSDFMRGSAPAPKCHPVPIHHRPIPIPAPVHVVHHSPMRECSPHHSPLRPMPMPVHLSPHRSPCRSPLREPLPVHIPVPVMHHHSPHRHMSLVHHHPIPMPMPVPVHHPHPVHHRISPHHSPLREPSPVMMRRASASPIRLAHPMRPHTSPSRCSPTRRPLLHLPEEDVLMGSLKEMCV